MFSAQTKATTETSSDVTKVYVGSLGDKQGAVVLRDELVQRLRKDHGIEVVPSPSEADAIITGTGEILLTGYKRPQCLHRAGARGFW